MVFRLDASLSLCEILIVFGHGTFVRVGRIQSGMYEWSHCSGCGPFLFIVAERVPTAVGLFCIRVAADTVTLFVEEFMIICAN